MDYKSKKITVAVPLRANINKQFQKERVGYIPTPPSEHTRNGCIAGWHITKIIPVEYSVLVKAKTNNSSLKVAEFIISENKQIFIDRIKNILERFERGENVFGAIDFDLALQKLDCCKIQDNSSKTTIDDFSL